MREVLTRLSEQGLVQAAPQIGFRVTPLSIADLTDLSMTRVDVETVALRHAIEHGDVAWEATAVAAHHTLQRTPLRHEDDPLRITDEWSAAHAAFHRALIDCARPRLLTITSGLWAASELYRRWSTAMASDEDRDIASEHLTLLNAAVNRDPDGAVAALTRHIRRTTDILLEGLRGGQLAAVETLAPAGHSTLATDQSS